MGLILDSSMLIAAERKKFDLSSLLEAEAPMEPVYISTITASELLHGVERATPEHRAKREAFFEAVLRETPSLAIDLACARIHAALWAKLEASGERIGPHDMWIAATCLRYRFRLATLNVGEFGKVEGLQITKT